MNRKKKHLIERADRNELIREILTALQKEGGVIYLKTPMTVWVDEMFGELPVTVKKIVMDHTESSLPDGFIIGNEYSDIHMDTNSLRELANNVL